MEGFKMPDIWTHILLGQDVLNALDDHRWKTVFETRIKLFNLGCQGPDMFLYNDFWPWIKNKRAVKLGDKMHIEKTGDFFIEGLSYLKKRVTSKEDYKKLFTYLAGFICHFSLDKNAHPYIHYYSGIYDKKKKETYKYKGNHKRLELMIDTILLKEKRNITTHKYPVYNEIDIGNALPKVIIDSYKNAISKLYKLDDNYDFINDSYRDTKRALKVIHDPYGIKKSLLIFADIITKGDLVYSSVIYPRVIDENRDYLNRNHNVWNHPCNKTEVYSDSFDDIFNRSVEQAIEMIKGAIEYLEDGIKEEDLIKIFPNISYSSGKHVDDKCELKYFDPIFK